jgi:hypothetical protein
MNSEETSRFESLLERCKNGKHIWKYWKGNDCVDRVTLEPTGMSTLLAFVGEEPEYRGCPICGKREVLIKYWEDRDAKKHNSEKVALIINELVEKGDSNASNC